MGMEWRWGQHEWGWGKDGVVIGMKFITVSFCTIEIHCYNDSNIDTQHCLSDVQSYSSAQTSIWNKIYHCTLYHDPGSPKQARWDGGIEGKVSRAPPFGGPHHRSKILKKGVPYRFFLTSNMHKIHFWLGQSLGPRWESLRCSPRHLGHPSPRFHPLDAYGMRL